MKEINKLHNLSNQLEPYHMLGRACKRTETVLDMQKHITQTFKKHFVYHITRGSDKILVQDKGFLVMSHVWSSQDNVKLG